MSLRTVRHLTPEEKESAISSAISIIAPPPLEREDFADPLGDQVLDEVNGKVYVKGEKVRAVQMKILGDELYKSLTGGRDLRQLRDQVGGAGLLNSTQYDISFTKDFRARTTDYGLTPEAVREVVVSCSNPQHLFPLKEGVAGAESHSIFFGSSPKFQNRILVTAVRNGARLLINGAWHIFDDDYEDSFAQSPLDVLRLFCHRYGLDVQVGHLREKLIVHTQVSFDPLRGIELHVMYDRDGPSDYYGTMSYLRTDRGVDISLAFAIRLDKYAASLDIHGITNRHKIVSKLGGIEAGINRMPQQL